MQLRCFEAAAEVLRWTPVKEAAHLLTQLPDCIRRAAAGLSIEEVLSATGAVADIEFIGPVMMANIPGKGRGLKATRHLQAGECVMVNRALVSVSVDENKEGIFIQTEGNSITTSSHARAAQRLSRACASDVALTRRLQLLQGAGADSPRLVPVQRLLQNLDLGCVPPLLPASIQFIGVGAGIDVVSAQRILNLNCHGNAQGASSILRNGSRVKDLLSGLKDSLSDGLRACHTALYPAVSLLNHDDNPNTIMIPVGSGAADIVAIVAAQDIPDGEELCTSYTSDKESLRRKWGIGL